MERKIALIGGGGHCGSVIDSLLSLRVYDAVGIVDPKGVSILGVPVLGTDDDLPRLFREGWTDALITVGSLGDTALRRRLYGIVKDIGFHLPMIVDPTAVVAREVKLGEGCFVGKCAVVNVGAAVGTCAIINTGAIVEHDCRIGAFAHISPGAVLCGQVRVGNDSHIGAGAVVRQQITVGHGVLIGAGSVVVNHVPDRATAYGNPCRVVVS